MAAEWWANHLWFMKLQRCFVRKFIIELVLFWVIPESSCKSWIISKNIRLDNFKRLQNILFVADMNHCNYILSIRSKTDIFIEMSDFWISLIFCYHLFQFRSLRDEQTWFNYHTFIEYHQKIWVLKMTNCWELLLTDL